MEKKFVEWKKNSLNGKKFVEWKKNSLNGKNIR